MRFVNQLLREQMTNNPTTVQQFCTLEAIENESKSMKELASEVAIHQSTLTRIVEKLEKKFDLVVANIVHDVLQEMAGDLVGATAKGGALILSGLLAGGQVESIVTIFENLGMQMQETRQRKEWASVLFKKI